MPAPSPPAELLAMLQQRCDPRIQRLMMRARECVWHYFKPKTEKVFEVKYTGAVWFGGAGPMKERPVYIAAFRNHVNVGFLYGASLPDPRGILKGTGKQMRHVQIRELEDLSQEGLGAVLRAAANKTLHFPQPK